MLEGKLVRVLSWYDNEWGFSNRMVDTAAAMGASFGHERWQRSFQRPSTDLPEDLTGKHVLVRVDLNVPMDGARSPTTRGCARCCRPCSN